MEELNLEEINALPVEEKAERLLEIAQQATAKAKERDEYVRKLESSQESGVQKLLDEKKYEKLLKEEDKILRKDANHIVELVAKDRKLAQAVLDEYYDGMSIEDALSQVDPSVREDLTRKQSAKNVEETVDELIAKKEVAKITKTFVDKAKLNAEEQAAFNKELAELTEGKKLSEANIEKYLRLALRESMPDVDVKKIEREAAEMAMGYGASQSQSTKGQHNARSSNISYLKSVGIL